MQHLTTYILYVRVNTPVLQPYTDVRDCVPIQRQCLSIHRLLPLLNVHVRIFLLSYVIGMQLEREYRDTHQLRISYVLCAHICIIDTYENWNPTSRYRCETAEQRRRGRKGRFYSVVPLFLPMENPSVGLLAAVPRHVSRFAMAYV